MATRRKPKQVEFEFRCWGGKRKGAGRKPKGKKALVSHQKRPVLSPRFPVHITLKVAPNWRSLRTKQKVKAIRKSFSRCCKKSGFRITDWSIQRDHIHLLAEAKDAKHLSKGMQGFCISMAKTLNSWFERSGRVFADRFHSRILSTPREVKNALLYILNNGRRHKQFVRPNKTDTYSSGSYFEGWVERKGEAVVEIVKGDPIAKTGSWLRRVGWRRHGLLKLNDIPCGTKKAKDQPRKKQAI